MLGKCSTIEVERAALLKVMIFPPLVINETYRLGELEIYFISYNYWIQIIALQ